MNVPAGDLASYKRCTEGIAAAWPAFQAARADRLRHGNETEKVAEAIIEDLFARVLDWDPGDLMYGVDYADIVVSRNLAKYLVIETKRPGTLWPGRKALHEAVRQARGYADRQNIKSVAASDGRFLYTADIIGGGLVDRLLVDLAAPEPPLGLWWVSMHGIYRPCEAPAICVPITSDEPSGARSATSSETNLLHPKYKLPVECFAYVPDASQPKTWKLPYR
ncbi:MAG: hypothetical protein KGO02_26060, partial [Alphaproteobacteria bacterium]|nr:hypothetical protein [Alphaproteobacteria bacterium]